MQLLQPTKKLFVINLILLAALALTMAVNQTVIAKLNKQLGINNQALAFINNRLKLGDGTGSAADLNLSGNIADDTIKLVISTGLPDIYGEELAVSFDQVQQSINIMRQFDPTYGKQKITLAGEELKRYINVGLKISCEYCCGAKSIILEDGRAACGCAHSIAMRGLAAYLIRNHGTEYTDDQILRELARWKGVYFPKQMIKKMAEQLQNNNYTPEIAALVLGLKLPEYNGQSQEVPLPSEIQNLPSMVGGC